MGEPLEVTLDYHARSKHRPGRFARALGYLDWDTQPDPFRRYEGAPTISLPLAPVGPLPRYEPALVRGHVEPAALDAASVGRLFQDSLALSAWKEGAGSRWALRVNPSSGNLHPTESYLIAGAVAGLRDEPAVYHYAPEPHTLELRSVLGDVAWRAIAQQLPESALLVGLSSIHWREAWKYGERGFRYCQHDVGHAIACIAVAAAGLGWDARVLGGVADDTLAALLGIDRQEGPEAEHPECLLAVYPGRRRDAVPDDCRIDETVVATLRDGSWQGWPNTLSASHHDWPVIDAVAAATRLHGGVPMPSRAWTRSRDAAVEVGDSALALRDVIHRRRSAVALDGRTGITRDAFHQILRRAVPGCDQVPFASLPWRPYVDLLLFVHRVRDVPPGLYALVRDPRRLTALRRAMDPSFLWRRSDGCPDALALYLLEEGDARALARRTSCNQDIAADGVFATAMLAEYREPLHALGPWMYRRLHWEAGAIGQVLYLEAEASGIRGTGIGCFFDDATHRVFGLHGDQFQVLYHFTMGGPVQDTRLQTHPPYAHLTSD
mgnify:CR=1 FL=1